MKSRNRARLGKAGRATGKPAKASTSRPTALALAGQSVGRFKKGTEDLSASQIFFWLVPVGETYVDAFAETIKDDELLKDSRLDKKPKVVLEEALERFYARKVIPFGGYQSHERPDFRVVVGCICGGKSHLFVSTCSVLKSVERFAAIGSGALVARPIVHRFMPPNIGTRSVSIKEAVVIAAHAVREAKDAVPGVGKDTDLLAMFENGGLSRTDPLTQDQLDAALKQYSTEVEPMVVRTIIGTRNPEKAFVEVKRLRAIVQDVLGESFTEPRSGKKSTQ